MLDICGIFWRLFIDGASSVLMKRFFFSNGLNVSSFFCTNHSRRTQIHRQHSMCVAWYDCTAVKALEKKNCLSFVLYEAIHSFLPRLPPLPRSFSLFYLWSCSEKSRRKPSCSGVLFRRTALIWWHKWSDITGRSDGSRSRRTEPERCCEKERISSVCVKLYSQQPGAENTHCWKCNSSVIMVSFLWGRRWLKIKKRLRLNGKKYKINLLYFPN